MPKKPRTPSLPPSTLIPSTFTDGLPLPSLFVFDLDYTLWPFWVDTHCTPPLRPSSSRNTPGTTAMVDRHGEHFSFYTHVPTILWAAKQLNIPMSVASRTHAPDVADTMLRGLTVSAPKLPPALDAQGGSHPERKEEKYKPVRALDFFSYPQIYPGSKTGHFRKIQKETRKHGREVAFRDMIFFDDEARNGDVETELGATFVLVRDGVTRDEIDRGVREWRRRRGVDVGRRQDEVAEMEA